MTEKAKARRTAPRKAARSEPERQNRSNRARRREAKTQAQAYADNKVYKMFVDSAAQLTTYGVQL